MEVENYGDMLSQVQGKKCLAFEMFGSYQGDWIAVLDAGENLELWKGYYGSCSGCDWLEANAGWGDYDLPEEKAKEYFKEDHPFVVIPKETMTRIDLKTFTEILPANTRSEIYDFSPEKLFKAIKKVI